MPTLGVSFPLHPDESLSGALFRVAGTAGYATTQQMIEFAGFSFTRLESIASKDPAVAGPAIAELLGVPLDEVVRHFHQNHPDGFFDFFGTRIRTKHRDITGRRVAPMALRQANYMRALWQLKPFSFDPHSLEMLLSNCPHCGKPLDYLRSLGVERCMACTDYEYGLPKPTIDFRDFPQPILAIEDREALDFVAGLIDPDPDVRASFAPNLDDELCSLTRGELFELTLALCCVADQDTSRSTTSIARPTTREDHARIFTPDALSAAGRAVMQWPGGFNQLCETARAGMAERGFFGAKAELGQIYALQVDRSLTQATRDVTRTAIARNMRETASTNMVRRVEFRGGIDLITTSAAAKKYGIRGKLFPRLARDGRVKVYRSLAKKGPVMFREDQIAEIAAIREDVEAVSSVGVRLGIPPSVVREIAKEGLLIPEGGPVLHLLVGKEYYRRSSVDRLISAIEVATKPNPGGSNYARLTKSMNALPPGSKPWVTVIKAILNGDLEVFQVEGRLNAVLIKLATRTQGELLDAVKGVVADASSPDRKVTRGEAAELLNSTTSMVASLAAFGALPRGIVTVGDVQRCAREYSFVPEIAARMKTSFKFVRARLAERNVHPAFAAGPDRGLVFSRMQVDAVLNAGAGND
jgi:hypothetical protein